MPPERLSLVKNSPRVSFIDRANPPLKTTQFQHLSCFKDISLTPHTFILEYNQGKKFMYICICKGITEKMLMDQIGGYNRSEEQILKNLGIGDSCGTCVVDAVKKILDTQNNLDSKTKKSDS